MNEQQLRKTLSTKSRSELENMLVDIYSRLALDENGEFNPNESVAAESAADFVDAVNYTFQKELANVV